METIYDVEFNETNDYFYVAKKRHLEVWQVNESLNSFTLIDTFKTYAGKFGKMLYIHNDPTHKILAFPYRLPFEGEDYEPPMNTEICFYYIDGDNPHHIDSVLAPSKRINDAAFLSGNDDLVLGYAPDEYIQDYVAPENSDIAVYHLNGSNFIYSGFLITNGFPQYNESEQLMNRPLHMFTNTSSSIILGKSHKIVRIFMSDSYYTSSQLYAGLSCFFSKTAKILSKDYIINPTLNGLAVYDENLPNEDISFIRTAYPVYNICANPINGNLYFSNRLSSENCGFYIFNPVTELSKHISYYSPDAVTQPIGDLIYNEFTGDYLVSENAKDENINQAHVKVFNGQTNQIERIIDIPGGQYAKEMFISPMGWLYIMFNMHEGLNPKILVLNAHDYSGNTIIPLDIGDGNDSFLYYTAEFLYNPKNRKVYITVSPNGIALEPYNPVINSMREYSGIGGFNGLLLELSSNQLDAWYPLPFPGKMICPDAEATEYSNNYRGKIFIKTNRLAIYQYDNPANPKILSDPKYNEIIYSSYHDMVYGLRDEIDEHIGYPQDREINIYQINSDGTSEWKFEYPGQAAAFFDNPIDTYLYLFVKIDDIKLGDTPATLLQLDPEKTGFINDYIDVDDTAFYIDYDNNSDYSFNFYNMLTPYIDLYSNQIYLPNGGHGNVSVVSFKAKEPYYLGSGIKWLSFPRLNRNSTDLEPAPDVLNRIKVPPDYAEGKMNNLAPNSNVLNFIEYSNNVWDYSEGGLSTVHSSSGYKMDYLYPVAQRYIIMEGSVWPANKTVKVHPRYENWIGYWLPETQSPFNAIPQNILDELTFIKAQYWSCVKKDPGHTKSTGAIWECACQQGRVEIKYGDMVILVTKDLAVDWLDLQWQRFGNPPDKEPKPETEYFTFTEKVDYTAYFIELDTTEQPQEIAALVNDTCVGATKVLPGDTLVLVPGYISGMDGEVTFEQYFGPEKSQKISNTDYLVYNDLTGRKEKRALHSKDNQKYYIISLKSEKSSDVENKEKVWIKCMPNPVAESFDIRYYIPASCEINISLLDLYGRKVSNIYHGYSVEGEHVKRDALACVSGRRLPAGVYYLVLEADTFKTETKVILID